MTDTCDFFTCLTRLTRPTRPTRLARLIRPTRLTRITGPPAFTLLTRKSHPRFQRQLIEVAFSIKREYFSLQNLLELLRPSCGRKLNADSDT